MTIALNVVVGILALVIALGAGAWAVGAQGTIDFSRDPERTEAARQEQKWALGVAWVSVAVGAAILLVTIAPSLKFVLIAGR